MKTKNYNWLIRLIDRITKTDCPNNDCFNYYGRRSYSAQEPGILLT